MSIFGLSLSASAAIAWPKKITECYSRNSGSGFISGMQRSFPMKTFFTGIRGKVTMKALGCLPVLALMGLPLSAAVTITGSDEGQISTLPASSTNFIYLGTATSDLTDFSVDPLQSGYPGNPDFYSEIVPPGGSGQVLTGIEYDPVQSSTPVNLVTFTLGTSPTFDYSDFNVFVLYSNDDVPVGEQSTDPSGPLYSPSGDNTQGRDASISLGAGTDATGLSATLVPVADINTDLNQARVVEFNVQGLSAGDQFTIAAAGTATTTREYIGAVSFDSNEVPEPATYAMFVAGLVFLGFCLRIKSVLRRGM
jgi:hypothetical protein